MAPLPSGWGAVKWYFAVDPGPPRLGVFQLLEDQRPRTLADDEAVAVHVERTRSVQGVVVARRERLHRVESADARLVHRGFRAARNHDVGLTVADGVEGIDHTVVGGGARRDGAVVRPHEPVLDRDVSRSDIGDHAGNKERAKPRRVSTLSIAQTFVEERFESPDPRTPDHAHLLQVGLFEIEPRILHGLRGGDQSILGEEVVFADLLAVEMLGPVVIFNLTSKPRLKFCGIEVRNRRSTTYPLFQIRKKLLNIIADRVDGTDTRNDYPSFSHKFKALRTPAIGSCEFISCAIRCR